MVMFKWIYKIADWFMVRFQRDVHGSISWWNYKAQNGEMDSRNNKAVEFVVDGSDLC